MSTENRSLYVEGANDYAQHSIGNLCNAQYERPAMLQTVGDLRGQRVLDAGCAAGGYIEELLAQGAHVTALDASQAMVGIVAERFGDAVEVRRHDLQYPVAWLENGSMDVVLASLTLHYIRDWSVPLSEFRRVLKPHGRLLLSTHHPAMIHAQLREQIANYFETTLVRDRWDVGGVEHEVQFYHRPLQDIVNAIVDAGFTIRRLTEPRLQQTPTNASQPLAGELSTTPWFLIVEAIA